MIFLIQKYLFIDTLDVKTLKYNYNLIKKLFNPILIMDHEEYHIVG